MKTIDIKAELRAHIARKYGKQKGAAVAWGVSSAYVSLVLSGIKPPNETMLADAGFKRVQPVAHYKKVKPSNKEQS